MDIKETEYYIEFKSTDGNGDFSIRILKDCSQIQMQTEDGDVYADINYRELAAIKGCITVALDGFNKESI